MRRRMLGTDSLPLSEIIDLSLLRWLEYALRLPVQRLAFRVLYACAGQVWEKRCGVQMITWHKVLMKLASALSSVGAFRFGD